ncbi:MAG: PadR family transcriptional regulator [Candidatus Dormiibacterota bacterium]
MPATTDFSLTPAAFQVLLSLASGTTHGYAVMREVEEVTGGTMRLGPGTLYRTIGRLLGDGLIEEVDDGSETDAPHDARRRRYRLTSLGQAVAQREAEGMARLVDRARAVGLLPSDAT